MCGQGCSAQMLSCHFLMYRSGCVQTKQTKNYPVLKRLFFFFVCFFVNSIVPKQFNKSGKSSSLVIVNVPSSWAAGWAAVPPWPFSPICVALWFQKGSSYHIRRSDFIPPSLKKEMMVWIKYNINKSINIKYAWSVFVDQCFRNICYVHDEYFLYVPTARNTVQTLQRGKI